MRSIRLPYPFQTARIPVNLCRYPGFRDRRPGAFALVQSPPDRRKITSQGAPKWRRRARVSGILVAASRADRAQVRHLVATRQWHAAEPDPARFRSFTARRAAAKAPVAARAIQGDTTDLQAVGFLTSGAAIHRAVGYVEVNVAGRFEAGSGFLVSPDLFLTNQHVIPDLDAAHGAQVTFDREMDELWHPRPTTTFRLDPERFALLSGEEDLDYALIAIGERQSGAATLAELSHLVLSNRPDRHVLGMNVNIIQHPGGLPKMIAVRNNILDYRTERTLLYETDTDHGSSGSPVLNDMWELVALHHYGEPFLEHTDDQGRPIPTAVNEGVRISAIYDDLTARLPTLSPAARALLQTALDYDRAPAVPDDGPALSPPHPSATRTATTLATRGAAMADPTAGQELRIVLPLEISVRVGGASAPTLVAASLAAPATRSLTRGAESLRIDKDYGNRGGYAPGFIDGFEIPLPEPGAALAAQVAPLRAGEPAAEQGELKYEHFSVKLNKAKRVALFTATNIDGPSYLTIDRTTGRVKEGAEGETWYSDPRVSASFFLDQSFYDAWSTYFDRGHLTRRTDPTWGEPQEAERANADTYHFTNCSPQHFRFNESATFWQGAERYVLEKGVLAADTRPRLVVFQGPIYADAIDRWAADVQIPSAFFKVIVWKGPDGLKAVGLVVDQLALLDEKRMAVARPGNAAADVKQWRVAIPEIEKRTGLDFGDLVRNADTIRDPDQPAVGEAQILIGSIEGILPPSQTVA